MRRSLESRLEKLESVAPKPQFIGLKVPMEYTEDDADYVIKRYYAENGNPDAMIFLAKVYSAVAAEEFAREKALYRSQR